MGYSCVYIQIRERALMDLDESEVSKLFPGANIRAQNSALRWYESPAMSDRMPPIMSLEKDWEVLHHLLTGEFRAVASPLSRAILGGKEIGEDLGGYGPARYLWADEVWEISSALSALTHEELRRRYDPAKLKAHWHDEDDDDEYVLALLLSGFDDLALYFRLAAARGNAMLIGIV